MGFLHTTLPPAGETFMLPTPCLSPWTFGPSLPSSPSSAGGGSPPRLSFPQVLSRADASLSGRTQEALWVSWQRCKNVPGQVSDQYRGTTPILWVLCLSPVILVEIANSWPASPVNSHTAREGSSVNACRGFDTCSLIGLISKSSIVSLE